MNYQTRQSILQYRPNCLVIYDYILSDRRRTNFSFEPVDFIESERRTYTGKLNKTSVKKMKQAISLLIAQAPWKSFEHPTTKKLIKFKVNFVTLTLSAPQFNVTDREIKSTMLKPWIQNMRRNFKLRSYVWRAERQKNGNIHFHFVTDTYLPYDAIRDAWNHLQDNYHFIEVFRHRNTSEWPNSTDVHSVQNIRNLSAYIVKYMSKDEKGLESIDGKVWDCSENLTALDYPQFEIDFKMYPKMNSILDEFKSKVIRNDWCTILPLDDKQLRARLPPDVIKCYNDFLNEVHNYKS